MNHHSETNSLHGMKASSLTYDPLEEQSYRTNIIEAFEKVRNNK